MRILISNDDGIYSPGIVSLAKAAARFGDVRIVAPDVEQSSMSHAITASRPLRFKRVHRGEFDAYSVNGTPADCVALGMHRWTHVDLVLSGINLGLNLGNSVWHSGTLAAAKQAALLGSRGIAFSTNVSDSHEPDFSALEPYVAKVLDLLLGTKTLSLVNVNLPERPKGIRWTRQSVRHYDGKVVPDKDPMGRSIFWFTVFPLDRARDIKRTPSVDSHRPACHDVASLERPPGPWLQGRLGEVFKLSRFSPGNRGGSGNQSIAVFRFPWKSPW